MVESVLKRAMGDIYDIMHLSDTSLFQLSREGKLVFRSKAWQEAHLSAKRHTGSAPKETLKPYEEVRLSGMRLFMLKRGKIPQYGYELVYAEDYTGVQESLRTLRTILLAGIPFALFLTLIGGYLLTRRTLSPVKVLTQKARQITAESLSERLPVSNPNDEIGGLAVVFNDTLSRLEESFDRLRRFTADVSHELRTPLTSIRSVGEVAVQGPVNSESCRETISSMLEDTERLTRLVDNLLTLSRGDSGQTKLDFEQTDLVPLVKKTADEMSVLAEEKKQVVSVEGQSSLMAVVDSETIRQAVMNVLHNAIRYTQTGGRITILLDTTDDRQAVIDIIDNGPGIPEAERSKVFGRFYRIDKSRSRIEGGAGLGLAIAQWAVHVNKGTIAFCDKDLPGSCCRITLPLR
jgi:heavy metal sensor kinase